MLLLQHGDCQLHSQEFCVGSHWKGCNLIELNLIKLNLIDVRRDSPTSTSTTSASTHPSNFLLPPGVAKQPSEAGSSEGWMREVAKTQCCWVNLPSQPIIAASLCLCCSYYCGEGEARWTAAEVGSLLLCQDCHLSLACHESSEVTPAQQDASCF